MKWSGFDKCITLVGLSGTVALFCYAMSPIVPLDISVYYFDSLPIRCWEITRISEVPLNVKQTNDFFFSCQNDFKLHARLSRRRNPWSLSGLPGAPMLFWHWMVSSWPCLWCGKAATAKLSLHMNWGTRNSISKPNKAAGKPFNIAPNRVMWKETTSENTKQVLGRGSELYRISESLGERVWRNVIRTRGFHFCYVKGLLRTDRKGRTVMRVLYQPSISHYKWHFWWCHRHILRYRMLHLSQTRIYCLERKWLKTGFMDSETKILISLTIKAILGQV